jgi:hypothetical protein
VIDAASSQRITPQVGASLRRSIGKSMIDCETTRLAWISLVT